MRFISVLVLFAQAVLVSSAAAQPATAPEETVTMLKERVRPVTSSDPGTVAKLIGFLDNDEYTEREKAQQSLEKMGDGAAHLLLKAVNGKVSPEAKRRLDELLRKCEASSKRSIQQQRAVAVLEWLGTPSSRALLRRLADGAPVHA